LQLKETKTNVSFDKKEIITDRRAIDQKSRLFQSVES
jgi:hypothetical protein